MQYRYIRPLINSIRELSFKIWLRNVSEWIWGELSHRIILSLVGEMTKGNAGQSRHKLHESTLFCWCGEFVNSINVNPMGSANL